MRVGFTSVGAGLIASVLAHFVLLIAVAVPHQQQTVHGETMTVDLVSPEEAAPAFKDEPIPETPQPSPQAEAQPDWSKLQIAPTPSLEQSQTSSELAARQDQAAQVRRQAQSQSAQQQRQGAQGPQQSEGQRQQQTPAPQAETQSAAGDSEKKEPSQNALAEQGARLASMLGLPAPGETKDYKFDDLQRADVATAEMAAFHAQLRKCWTLPPGYSPDQNVEVIIRVPLRPNGTLARDLTIGDNLIKGPTPTIGLPLIRSAFQALKQCQPYTMLPADKYQEWQVLDLNFSPHLMSGG